MLRTADLGVGERAQADAHEMYVGYAGPMAWEYQFERCDAQRPNAPSECACVASNNLDDYTTLSGSESCEAEDDGSDWCGL